MSRAEVRWEPPSEPVEERHAESATDGVSHGVADDRTECCRAPDRHGVDVEAVMCRHHRCGDQHDLSGERDAEAFCADHAADSQVDQQRGDRLE